MDILLNTLSFVIIWSRCICWSNTISLNSCLNWGQIQCSCVKFEFDFIYLEKTTFCVLFFLPFLDCFWWFGRKQRMPYGINLFYHGAPLFHKLKSDSCKIAKLSITSDNITLLTVDCPIMWCIGWLGRLVQHKFCWRKTIKYIYIYMWSQHDYFFLVWAKSFLMQYCWHHFCRNTYFAQ